MTVGQADWNGDSSGGEAAKEGDEEIEALRVEQNEARTRPMLRGDPFCERIDARGELSVRQLICRHFPFAQESVCDAFGSAGSELRE
jgi:hypothetical protein